MPSRMVTVEKKGQMGLKVTVNKQGIPEILEVVKGGAAEKAGVKVGEGFASVDGKKTVKGMKVKELTEMFAKEAADGKVVLELFPKGEDPFASAAPAAAAASSAPAEAEGGCCTIS